MRQPAAHRRRESSASELLLQRTQPHREILPFETNEESRAVFPLRRKWSRRRQLPHEGTKKRVEGSRQCCAGSFPPRSSARLPTLTVSVNGVPAVALLDSGCSTSVAAPRFAASGKKHRRREKIFMMNGESVISDCCVDCDVQVGSRSIMLSCLVAKVIPGFDILLGMDAIAELGGVSVSRDGLYSGRWDGSNSLCGRQTADYRQ